MDQCKQNKMQSEASKRRELRRNSASTIEFREEIILLLENAEPDVAYSIKRDLSIMTDMPFYKQPKQVVKSSKNSKEMIRSYALLLMDKNDMEFASKLMRELSKNQSQIIRKLAPRSGGKKHIWEHVIPTKVITGIILEMIHQKDLSKIDQLLELYIKAGQRSVTKEENKLLAKYNCTMPENWDWNKIDVDPFARHKIVGITIE